MNMGKAQIDGKSCSLIIVQDMGDEMFHSDGQTTNDIVSNGVFD